MSEFTVLRFEVIPSTNDIARAAGMEGCPAWTVFVAREQSLGRGRRGRSWSSPSGGLWMSILARPALPEDERCLITLAVAVAVNKVLRSCGVESRIKWPNDLVVNGKKVGGILCESVVCGENAGEFVVIGVGLNLNVDCTVLPGDIGESATSVSQETGRFHDPDDILSKIVESIRAEMERLEAGEGEAVLSDWRSTNSVLGRRVTVVGLTERLAGTAIDIDHAGALILETASGLRRVLAGDVSLRPEG